MIPSQRYKSISMEEKALVHTELIYHLQRLQQMEPRIAREATAITNTLYTNNPHLNAPRAVVEAYAALCVYQQHKPWMPPQMIARLKTWLNHAGAQMD